MAQLTGDRLGERGGWGWEGGEKEPEEEKRGAGLKTDQQKGTIPTPARVSAPTTTKTRRFQSPTSAKPLIQAVDLRKWIVRKS